MRSKRLHRLGPDPQQQQAATSGQQATSGNPEVEESLAEAHQAVGQPAAGQQLGLKAGGAGSCGRRRPPRAHLQRARLAPSAAGPLPAAKHDRPALRPTTHAADLSRQAGPVGSAAPPAQVPRQSAKPAVHPPAAGAAPGAASAAAAQLVDPLLLWQREQLELRWMQERAAAGGQSAAPSSQRHELPAATAAAAAAASGGRGFASASGGQSRPVLAAARPAHAAAYEAACSTQL